MNTDIEYKIMKRAILLLSVLTVMTVMLVNTVIPAPVYAGQTVQSRYETAKQKLAAVKKRYRKASDKYNESTKEFRKGSRGFFRWVVQNKSGWIKEDARDALNLLNNTAFKKYVRMGNQKDATNLDNMKHALVLLKKLQTLRNSDENFTNLPPVTIRSIYMARAQVNADGSSVTYNHLPVDKGYGTEESGENLAWGVKDPFDLWYKEEKAYYNKARKYIIRKYGYDINKEKDLEKFTDKHSDFDEIMTRYGDIIHYTNAMAGQTQTYDFDNDTIIYAVADHAIFGLGYGTGKGGGSKCSCLSDDCFDNYDEAMSLTQYRKMFNEYYNHVSAPEEKAALKTAKQKLNKAKARYKKAKKALAKVLKVNPSVKRNGVKISIKWKKNKTAAGYQVSVSGNKHSKIVKARYKRTALTVKTKSQKYVRVRAYYKSGKKIVYGTWSPYIWR